MSSTDWDCKQRYQIQNEVNIQYLTIEALFSLKYNMILDEIIYYDVNMHESMFIRL